MSFRSRSGVAPRGHVTGFGVRQHFARSSLRLYTAKSFWDFVRKATPGICVLPDRRRSSFFYLAQLCNFGRGIAKDRDDPAGLAIDVDKCAALDAVVTFPADGVVSVGFLEVDGFRIPIAG